VGKHLYHLANLPKYKSKVTKELASKLMTAYGYMLFDIRHLDWNSDRKLILDKAKAPLEHRFNNHVYCDPSWCRSKRAANEGKIYTAPDHDPFYCKEKNSDMYFDLKKLFDLFTCEEVIKDSVHQEYVLPSLIQTLALKSFTQKSSNASEYPTSKRMYSQTFF
jgi:hypothetical protein